MKEGEIRLIQSWEKVLKDFLDPLDFIGSLFQVFALGSEEYRSVLAKRKVPHEAVAIAITEIIKQHKKVTLDDFIAAINEAGSPWLAELVSGEITDDKVEDAVTQQEDYTALKTFLTLISPHLKATIQATDVADRLRADRIIKQEEFETIECRAREDGNRSAVMHLLSTLVRKPPGWLKSFTKILQDLNYDQSLVNSLQGLSIQEPTQCASDVNKEEGIHENGSEVELKALPVGSRKPTLAAKFDMTKQKAKTSGTSLRMYQKSLASDANDGKNVIICAPTGSGKTRVAAHVIYTRFNQKLDEENPKVAFIVPRVALAKQQCDNLKKTLKSKEWCVDYLIGDSKTSLKEALQSSNVIVLTPQILLNALKDGSVHSIKVFKLLVFDECHHTMKESPYNMIMLQYLELKDGGCEDLPQIIGLTATLGVGRGKLDDSAIDHMMSLCANLDATGGIVTVPLKHKDELNHYTPQPEEENIALDDEITDPFTLRMCETIDELVNILYSLNIRHIKGTTRPHPLPKGDQQYIQWCQDFEEKAIHSLTNDPDVSRDVQTCIEYLRIFNEAFDLNLKCRSSDALKFLENKLNQPYHADLLSTERRLYETSRNSIMMLKEDIQDPRCANPNLKQMQREIIKTFESDRNSRVMLNVLKRQYAEPIRDWLNESEELGVLRLNAEYFTGVGRSREGAKGLTHNKQEQILEMFRNGNIKVLVCTPAVASEGLDIVNCNLVICYDYVKNEVSKTQVKGRARKEGGRMVQFSSRKVMARDKVNIAKTLLMEKTTQIVQTKFQEDKQNYMKELLKLQKDAAVTARLARKYGTEKEDLTLSDKFQVICKKCSEPVCSGDDIVKLEKTNHTCVTKKFKLKYNSRVVDDGGTEEKKGLYCKKCDSMWGIFSRYKRILIPQLYSKSFKFLDSSGSASNNKTGSQWNKINIEFKVVTYDEIRNMIDEEEP